LRFAGCGFAGSSQLSNSFGDMMFKLKLLAESIQRAGLLGEHGKFHKQINSHRRELFLAINDSSSETLTKSS
jgi:hypothetical protein